VQYLQHEFRKIFHDVRDKRVWKLIDWSLEGFPKRDGEGSFWQLIAGISEGWKLKRVFELLSDTSYRWRLEKIPVWKLVLGGMSPTIDRYTVKKFNRNPLRFAEAWKKNAQLRKAVLRTGFASHPERDQFPIFVFESGNGFRVFDGMRRTLLALIAGRTTIKAWVGYKVNRNGKPLISPERAWFLENIYENASTKDVSLEKAILRIGKEIIKNYRNGKEVLDKRIASWSHDPDFKTLVRKMIRSK